MNYLYSFIYRGILTDASLDKAGRLRRRVFGVEDAARLREALSFEMLDQTLLTDAQRMAIVYSAIHTFENMVREFVKQGLAENHGEAWWEKVPSKVQKKVTNRLEEDSKFRFHGARGGSEIMYCDFGDLSSIIVTNWDDFEGILADMNWAKSVLDSLEKSRNIVMHGGSLENEDIARVGMNIRDWIRQTG